MHGTLFDIPPVVPSPPCLFIFLWLDPYIAATLQPVWPFLSCHDPINLDASETMNHDITIWALATCLSKNQLVFGQKKNLNRESKVVWQDI